MTLDEAQSLVARVRHWHHRFEIHPGLVTPGAYDPGFLLDMLQLPARLDGLRVLDVGTSDGYFAQALWRRGAAVTAVDYRRKTDHGFWVTEAVTGMQAAYETCNVYDLSPATLGRFDIVLFLGVLYHLPDPLRALHLLHGLTAGRLFIETHCDTTLPPGIAAARYYREGTLAGDRSNFWSPNRLCVLDMLVDAGFRADRDEAWGDRLFVACTRLDAGPGEGGKVDQAYASVRSPDWG